MLDGTAGVKLLSGELANELLVEKRKVKSLSVTGWFDVDAGEVRRKAASFHRFDTRRRGEFLTSLETSLSELLSISLLLVYKLKRQWCVIK